MAEYISFQPTDFFNTLLYTGDGVAIGSGGQAITGVGFQPDIVWAKQRSGTEKHDVCDAVRGTTKTVTPNSNAAEVTNTETLTTFGADGFTVGNSGSWNNNLSTYVSWNWKAGTTSGITGGTITPSSYSINTTSGCGIYAYAGTGATGTIAHGLGATPKFMVIKCLDAASTDWVTWISPMAVNEYMYMNSGAVKTSDTAFMNSVLPSSTLISLGDRANSNGSGKTFIAYVFAEKKGYSKFGSYKGNTNADGQFIYTGFRPAYFLIKATNGSGEPWLVWNNKTEGRNALTTNGNNRLTVSSTAAEDATSEILICSNGIKLLDNSGHINSSSYTYAYAAFSEFPIVSSNDVPTVAR